VLHSKGVVLSIEVKLLKDQQQVSVRKLSFTEPSQDMSKRQLVSESKGFYDRCEFNCNGYKLFTGYRLTGIKAAGTLHRVLYGTWENCPVDEPKSSRENQEILIPI
jgi:hypothetical protein